MNDIDELLDQLAEETRAYVEERFAAIEAKHAVETAELHAKLSGVAAPPPREVDYERVAAVVKATVGAAFAALPAREPGSPGKDAVVDYDHVGEIVSLAVAKAVANVQVKDGAPGKDASPVDYTLVREFANAAAVNAVASIPKPDHGKDAYALAREHGFSGDVVAWLASLKGKDGDRGEAGDPGDMGERGTDGARGDQGPSGLNGKDADETVIATKVLTEVVKQIPIVRDGKDADEEAIASRVLSQVVKQIPVPQNGKDADPELVRAEVARAVADEVAKLPAPEPGTPGKDADHAAIAADVLRAVKEFVPALIPAAKEIDEAAIIERIVARIPPPVEPKMVDDDAVVARVIAQLPRPVETKAIDLVEIATLVDAAVARAVSAIQPVLNKSVEQADASVVIAQEVARVMAEIPKPQDGKSVEPSHVQALVDGAVAKMLSELPQPKDGESVHPDTVALMVRDAVAKAMESVHLPRDGKPGRDALDLEILESIELGKSYPAGTFALHDGGTVLALRDTDPIEDDLASAGWRVTQDGIKEVVREECEDERMTRVVVCSTSGKRFTVDCVTASGMKDQGVFRPGMKYRAGDCVTFDESYWTARSDTQSAPPGGDWRLILKGKRRG